MTLFTIGYEQAKSASVIDELKRARVGLVVDTRAVAASRRPGFSKRQLAAGLDAAGIGYLHLQKLGTPRKAVTPRAPATSRSCSTSTRSSSRRRRHASSSTS